MLQKLGWSDERQQKQEQNSLSQKQNDTSTTDGDEKENLIREVLKKEADENMLEAEAELKERQKEKIAEGNEGEN